MPRQLPGSPAYGPEEKRLAQLAGRFDSCARTDAAAERNDPRDDELPQRGLGLLSVCRQFHVFGPISPSAVIEHRLCRSVTASIVWFPYRPSTAIR
jgi:hypothetical protein